MFALEMADCLEENHTAVVHEPHGLDGCFSAAKQLVHPLAHPCCSMASTLIHSQLFTSWRSKRSMGQRTPPPLRWILLWMP